MFIWSIYRSAAPYMDIDFIKERSYIGHADFYSILRGVCFRNFRSMEARTGFPFRDLAMPFRSRIVYKVDEPSQYKRLMFEQLLVWIVYIRNIEYHVNGFLIPVEYTCFIKFKCVKLSFFRNLLTTNTFDKLLFDEVIRRQRGYKIEEPMQYKRFLFRYLLVWVQCMLSIFNIIL